jgi:hypothetical protein
VTEHTSLDDAWPLAALIDTVAVPDLVSEGPVRFLLTSGDRDDSSWGIVGAYWLSIDGERGGFVISSDALWRGSELARCYRSALRRGWEAEGIYRWWQGQVGAAAGGLMVDPQQHADTLFHVYRRVGAL